MIKIKCITALSDIAGKSRADLTYEHQIDDAYHTIVATTSQHINFCNQMAAVNFMLEISKEATKAGGWTDTYKNMDGETVITSGYELG